VQQLYHVDFLILLCFLTDSAHSNLLHFKAEFGMPAARQWIFVTVLQCAPNSGVIDVKDLGDYHAKLC
jgi:hypothetical protein